MSTYSTSAEQVMHPALAASISMALDSAAVLQRAQYVSDLRAHDWTYEWSDDHTVYLRGRAERQALRAMADQIDPDRAIWNAHAPADCRVVR